jgi:hypothetical protein
MRQYFVAVSLAVLLSLSLLGCGSSTTSNPMSSSPGAATVPVSITIHDTPPGDANILQFKIELTAATLQPAGMNQQPIDMLPGPQDVELIHLQTESAFLANRSVPAGQYSSLTVTFADPRMVLFNSSSTTTFTVGNQSCAPMQTCNLTPPLNQMTVTISNGPFPITLSANSPLALDLHFDVNASVQSDLSVTPMVSLTQLPVPPNAGGEHTHIFGVVTAVTSPTFTLQSGFDGTSSTITTDSNTEYHFGQSCAADNFSCIMVGQLLKVKVNVMSNGTLEATDVRLIQAQGLPAFHGTITAVNAAQSQFQIAVDFDDMPEGGDPHFQPAAGAHSVTVQLSSSTTFSIDSDNLTLPSGLSFAGVQDLVVGQTVEFQPALPVTTTGTPPMVQITVGATSVQLEPTQITATVSAVNAQASPPNFILNSLPSLFTGAGITQIQVDTVMGTDFENINGIGALSTGQTVSVSGLLFNTPTQPTAVAVQVKQRHGDD